MEMEMEMEMENTQTTRSLIFLSVRGLLRLRVGQAQGLGGMHGGNH